VGARNAQNILFPPPVAAERFTDAIAAVARLEEIYERNAAFLRESFESYLRGEPPAMPPARLHAV
jgi:AMP nucleosidase